MDIVTLSPADSLDAFIEFPFSLYADSPYWIPPIITRQKALLGKDNPLFERVKVAYFMAKVGEKVLGRISVSIDPKLNTDETVASFGFFECVKDYDVAKFLFDSAKAWASRHGVRKVLGPIDLSTRYSVGMLERGFDTPPCSGLPYSMPYYIDLASQFGMKVNNRCYAYRGSIEGPIPKEIEERYKSAAQEFQFRMASPESLKSDLRMMMNMYNEVWEAERHFLWSNCEEKELDRFCAGLEPIVDCRLFIVVEKFGKPAGLVFGSPNYAKIFKDLRGTTRSGFEFKFSENLQHQWHLSEIKTLLLIVREEHQGRGLASALNYSLLNSAKSAGYTVINRGIIWEQIIASRRQAERSGAKEFKRYILFEFDT